MSGLIKKNNKKWQNIASKNYHFGFNYSYPLVHLLRQSSSAVLLHALAINQLTNLQLDFSGASCEICLNKYNTGFLLAIFSLDRILVFFFVCNPPRRNVLSLWWLIWHSFGPRSYKVLKVFFKALNKFAVFF